MLQYLIILLDETATSYCHYGNLRKEARLMPLEVLRDGIRFAMKENLTIQFVYPDHDLPQAYREAVESIDHSKILPSILACPEADVVVFDGLEDTDGFAFRPGVSYVLRVSKAELFACHEKVAAVMGRVGRLNVVLTDVETFTEEDFGAYERVLEAWVKEMEGFYLSGRTPQLNVLTDRMMLDKMNNCGAGETNVTLAPDGKFYVCPAFYQDEGGYAIGNLFEGLDIRNPQLYRLDHAPLCRRCDAYQCKRCVWLNRKTTWEVNTPSHEQCVLAHLERNASRELLNRMRNHGSFLSGQEEIEKIDYLDPFEVRKKG